MKPKLLPALLRRVVGWVYALIIFAWTSLNLFPTLQSHPDARLGVDQSEQDPLHDFPSHPQGRVCGIWAGL